MVIHCYLVIFATSGQLEEVQSLNFQNAALFPLKTFIEKSGSFTNFNGKVQNFKKVTTIVNEAFTAAELTQLLAGEDLTISPIDSKDLMIAESVKLEHVRFEHRKKNEFLFNK